MKLRTYDRDKCNNDRDNQRPYITFRRSGLVILSPGLCNLLNVKLGDGVVIAQNEDDVTEWFIAARKSDEAFRLRYTKNERGVTFNSRRLVRDLITAGRLDSRHSFRFLVASLPYEEGGDMYAILTGSLKK